jgi:ribose-phosphate pyrophosphokinase
MEIEPNTVSRKIADGDVNPFVVVSSPEMHGVAQRVVETIQRDHGIGLPHYPVTFERFKNGELLPRIPETVRRQHVFFFHAMQVPSPNDGIMSALLMNDALRRASVAGITLVAPYLPYLRQDRKDQPRAPISAKMLADVLGSNPSLERVITADMHTDQAQGFFSVPVDNISCMKLFALYAMKHVDNIGGCVMGAPDVGGVVRAERFGLIAGSPYIAFCQKKRPAANKSITGATAGDPVKGRRVIMVDDMIDTGGSTIGAAKKFAADGATTVDVFATHAIFSDGAEERLAQSGLRIFTTNSIPRSAEYAETHKSWLSVIPIEDLLAAAVHQASLIGGSVSKLSV